MAHTRNRGRGGNVAWIGIPTLVVIATLFAVYHFRGQTALSSPSPTEHHRATAPRIAFRNAIDPLTGLAETQHGPLVATMVDNSPEARPQAGLTAADVVYEAYTQNFYYSRLMLIFYGNAPKKVGPVRSAHPYFAAWVDGWHAAYARAGGSIVADQDIQKWGIHDMDWLTVDQALYHRTVSRPAPYDVYSSLPTLMRYAENRWGNPPVAPHWPFEADVTRGTPPYRTLTVVWNRQNTVERWVWDQRAQQWARWIRCAEGCATTAWTPVVDANNDQQVQASNVVFQYTHEVLDTKDPDPTGLRVLINTVGSGKALLFLGHHFYVGTWRKASLQSPTRFYLPDGKLAPFQPGQTWIEVVPEHPNQSAFSLTLSRH